MNHLIKNIAIVLVVILAGLAVLFWMPGVAARKFPPNKLVVTWDRSLSPLELKVEQEILGITPNWLVFDRGAKHEILIGEGENDFTVVYKDEQRAQIRQVKEYKTDAYTYAFHFKKDVSGQVSCVVSFLGKDTLHQEINLGIDFELVEPNKPYRKGTRRKFKS